MTNSARLALIKIWKAIHVKFFKSALLTTMNVMSRWWPLLHMAMVTIVLSQAIRVTADENACYCEEGCFLSELRTPICCSEICQDAEARSLQAECKRKCPNYPAIKRMKDELLKTKTESNADVVYWQQNYEEAKLKLKTMWENYNSTRMELRRLKNKLRDMESSGQLISGLATPICLFGALIIILVVLVCLYQKSEGSKDDETTKTRFCQCFVII